MILAIIFIGILHLICGTVLEPYVNSETGHIFSSQNLFHFLSFFLSSIFDVLCKILISFFSVEAVPFFAWLTQKLCYTISKVVSAMDRFTKNDRDIGKRRIQRKGEQIEWQER